MHTKMTVVSIIVVSLLFIGSSICQAQGCGWKDAMDPAAASNDPGRGLSNWKIHYDHVMIQDGMNVNKLIANRLQTLSLCLSNDSYARLYADLSVLIAKVGIQKAGWQDAMDASASSQDPGRGLLDWQIHYKHCLGSGRSNVHVLVGERLSTLKNAISKEAYAKLYADASVLIAKYGRD